MILLVICTVDAIIPFFFMDFLHPVIKLQHFRTVVISKEKF
jgi:hypothetical protein